jgi:hypothetical protein
VDDYLRAGVAWVWLLDPRTRRAWIYGPQSFAEVRDGLFRTESPAFAVPLADLFEDC